MIFIYDLFSRGVFELADRYFLELEILSLDRRVWENDPKWLFIFWRVACVINSTVFLSKKAICYRGICRCLNRKSSRKNQGKLFLKISDEFARSWLSQTKPEIGNEAENSFYWWTIDTHCFYLRRLSKKSS